MSEMSIESCRETEPADLSPLIKLLTSDDLAEACHSVNEYRLVILKAAVTLMGEKA